MSDTDLAASVLTLIIMLVGVAGVVVPVLPDVWLIWLAALGYGLVVGFDGWVGAVAMVLLTLLTIAGIVADLAVGPVVAKQSGVSWQAIAASLALGLAGLLLFPPFGALIGAVLGLFGVEYLRRGRDTRQALQAVKSYALGCGWSVALRLAICVVMIGIWGVWVWIGHG